MREGEFFSSSAPSGSGKTTCLRLVAGFDEPTSAGSELHGRDVVGVPPYDRDVNTVFQDYALFPHMTVAENVADGLRVQEGARSRAGRACPPGPPAVRLPDLGERRPAELSGGQRQRVALARALVAASGAAPRRAPGRPRPQAPTRDADGAAGAATASGHHLPPCHPRPGGGPLHELTGWPCSRTGASSRWALRKRSTRVPAAPFVAAFVGESNRSLAGESGASCLSVLGLSRFHVRPEKISPCSRPERKPEPGEVLASWRRIAEATYLGRSPALPGRATDVPGEPPSWPRTWGGALEARSAPGQKVRVTWAPCSNTPPDPGRMPPRVGSNILLRRFFAGPPPPPPGPLSLLFLIAPPLLWLASSTSGSLGALLVQSFFHLDGFTGRVVREPTPRHLARSRHATPPRHSASHPLRWPPP